MRVIEELKEWLILEKKEMDFYKESYREGESDFNRGERLWIERSIKKIEELEAQEPNNDK